MSLPLMDSASSATLSQPSNSGIFMETLTSMTIFYAAFRTLASYTTSQEFCRKWDIKSHVGLDVANKTISALFATISALSGTYILSTYGGNYYTDSVLTYFMPFSMGYFLYDLGAMCQVYLAKLESEEDKQKERSFLGFLCSHPLMSIHHLALSLFFIPLMISRRDHYPGDPMLACALLMEASTPFVSFRAILHNLGLRKSLIYVINGLLMVLVFFACRILIYPWFYHVHSLAKEIDFIEAVMKTPPRCAILMTLALLPQIYWFKIMLMGALKVLQEKRTNKKVNNPKMNNNQLKID